MRATSDDGAEPAEECGCARAAATRADQSGSLTIASPDAQAALS